MHFNLKFKYYPKYALLFLGFFSLILLSSNNIIADGIPEVNRKKSSVSSSSKKMDSNKENTLPAYSLPESELAKYQYCGKDSDCMQVINGCCQCLQGDPFTTINKNMLEDFRKKFNCNKVTCPDDNRAFSCHDGLVSCINYRCHYYPPDE
jgi:hypothetical protein